jgi:NitT/TauT family transport system ATP-binding protein
MATRPPLGPAGAGVHVRLSGVRRVFPGGVAALDGIDLEIAPGSFTALLGPSGCGKSTLLRMVARLDRPDAGEVEVAADPSAAHGSRLPLAYVFQDAHLLPWRRVRDNVALPLELMGAKPQERRDAAQAALEQVGLGEAAQRYPAELSGGMRMRVSIARAIVTRPRLLLMDEPFAALDEITRARLDDQLRALWMELGMTILFVTHSLTEAAYLAERAIVLSPRPARVVADRIIDLPRERAPVLRTDAAFAREVHTLYEALERGGSR